MPLYAQIDSNQQAMCITRSAEPITQENMIPIEEGQAVLGQRWTGSQWEDVAAAPSTTTLSPIAFLRRFTAPERAAIRASANPYVVDFMDLLNKATEVLQSDPDVQGGMAYLVSLGLLSQARADEILAW